MWLSLMVLEFYYFITISSSDPRDTLFESFKQTYRLVTFTMVIGLIYPNLKKAKKQLAMIFAFCIITTPIVAIIVTDMLGHLRRGDIFNVTRHCNVVIPFIFSVSKILLMYYNRIGAKQIIDIINRDQENFKSMSLDYKTVAEDGIKEALVFVHRWLVIATIVALTFPVVATTQNLNSQLFAEVPERYMVHDASLPFLEPEVRLQSPYFEIIYIYMSFMAFVFFVSFFGHDGFFGIAVKHACLKMNIFCHTLEKAFESPDDGEFIKKRMAVVIKEQCEMYDFVNLIQNTFNVWLGIIFFGTVIQMCNCMVQVLEGDFDVKFFVLFAGTILHLYLPCRNAANLKFMSTEVATKFYCCGWERVSDTTIRRQLVYMTARAQIPTGIIALNMFSVDMELFVSLIRTSYSMFTLLRE